MSQEASISVRLDARIKKKLEEISVVRGCSSLSHLLRLILSDFVSQHSVDHAPTDQIASSSNVQIPPPPED